MSRAADRFRRRHDLCQGPELQAILETWPVMERMQKVLPLLRKEIEVAQLQSEISDQVNAQMQDRQREFFLREQLKVIQRELGISKDDRENDVDTFRKRLDRAHGARAGDEPHRRRARQALGARDRLAGVRHHPQLSRLADLAALGRHQPGSARPQARPHGTGPRP